MTLTLDTPYKIKLIAELPGHEDRSWTVSWNPTKPLLASCSADKSVRIYSYTKSSDSNPPKFGHLTTISTGHSKAVRSIAWSPSGEVLATASFDSNIGIWEPENRGEDYGSEGDGIGWGSGEWECATLLEGHETECKSVAYSSNGNLLASCSRDKTVWVWEVQPDSDFECMGVLMEHSQDVKHVAWHPSEEILASASYDDTIQLYIDDPMDDWFCFDTLSGHNSTVWSLAWSPDGKYLASGSDDKTVRVWKRIQEHKWECVLVLGGHERTVYSVAWGVGKPDPKSSATNIGWLASTGSDGGIRVWELCESSMNGAGAENSIAPPTHKLIAYLPETHGVHDVNCVSWCPRSGFEYLLATTGDDGVTRVWKVET